MGATEDEPRGEEGAVSHGGSGEVAGDHGALAPDARRAECDAMRAEGNRLVVSGSVIGAATVASTLLLGATCPLCVIGVPALIGFGFVQRVRGELQLRALERQADADGTGDGTS